VIPILTGDTRLQRAVGSRAVLWTALALQIRGCAIRVSVYIDGFNLYYGALKGTSYKWINLVELSKQLVDANSVINKVKYFTARASGLSDPDLPRRQHLYISALKTLPEVEVHLGNFIAKTVWRPLANLPIADATIHSAAPIVLPGGNYLVNGGSLLADSTLPVDGHVRRPRGRRGPKPRPLTDALIVETHTMEEKGSDVNLAAHLLNDAWKNEFDAAVVISNDTDLVTPIRMVVQEQSKPIYVVCPGKWQMAPALQAVATYKRHIHNSMLAAAQFPITIPGTAITKPPQW